MVKEKEVKTTGFLFLASVLFVAFNMRAPITGVGTLVGTIQSDLSLSGSVAGFLTTIPLLAFAVVSPLVGRVAERIGLGRTLFYSMLVIAVGGVIRSYAGTAGLLLGTAVMGIGIACGNVLLPVVVKGCYPDRIGPMTGTYATAQSLFAGLSSAVCVPLSVRVGLGWRGALAIWSVPALLAAVLWFSRRSLVIETPKVQGENKKASVLRSPIAWFCTLYMGSQAILFYSSTAWFPAVLTSRGMDAATAGLLASLYQLIGIPVNFLAPMLAGRMKNQRVLTGCVSIMYVSGMCLMWLAKAHFLLALAVLMCGLSTGCCFSLCMALIGMRTHNAADAAALSGMTQSIGYIIAAIGPVLIGSLFDLSGGWAVPMLAMVIGTLINALAGQLAGKPGYVE